MQIQRNYVYAELDFDIDETDKKIELENEQKANRIVEFKKGDIPSKSVSSCLDPFDIFRNTSIKNV